MRRMRRETERNNKVIPAVFDKIKLKMTIIAITNKKAISSFYLIFSKLIKMSYLIET